MKKNSTPKDQLKLRLAGYAATAGAMMLIGTQADGQVVYSGVVDSLLDKTNDYYALDMDGDGTTDFQFSIGGTTWSSMSFYRWAYFGNARTYSYANSFAFDTYRNDPIAFDQGELVNSDISLWHNSGYDTLGWVYQYTLSSSVYAWRDGNFPGEGAKFIGVRFHIGADIHYGWVRVEVPWDVTSVTVHDWAYEETPNTGITTGDGLPTVVADNKQVNIQAYPNPVKSTLHVKAEKPSTFILLNIEGKELLKKTNITEADLNMDSYASGVYMLKVVQGSKTYNQKIVKK